MLMGIALVLAQDDMRALVERCDTDLRAVNRFYGVPASPAHAQRLEAFFAQWQKTLAGVDFAALSQDGRIDYLLLNNHLRHELAELRREQAREQEIREIVPFAGAVAALETARRDMESVDPKKIAEQLADLAKTVRKLRDVTPRPVLARRAANLVRDLRATLKTWHQFYSGYDPLFTWWVGRPYQDLDRELHEFESALKKRFGGAEEDGGEKLVGDPIGREALLAELAHEMVPYTPEELVEIANREFAWCDVEMKRAAADLKAGSWAEALEKVKKLHVEPGRQPDLVRDLAREALTFVDDRNLVTVPELCREIWRMEMMPPERQKITPFFTGGEVISVSYPSAEMPHEQKLMSMRGNNIHFSRATVHHEIIPGHHLQKFMSSRYHAYRRPFNTAFLVEGWALYWEMLLWDLKFPRSAEDRVGMLFWRSHRCARIIVSLGFHLGTMKPAEMVDFLVKRVGHEPDGAMGEVRRYIAGGYGPLYQCAYMLGGLQIRSLRAELSKMSDRDFHDGVLKENAIPIEMIRASLTKQNLTPEFSTNWKFSK